MVGGSVGDCVGDCVVGDSVGGGSVGDCVGDCVVGAFVVGVCVVGAFVVSDSVGDCVGDCVVGGSVVCDSVGDCVGDCLVVAFVVSESVGGCIGGCFVGASGQTEDSFRILEDEGHSARSLYQSSPSSSLRLGESSGRLSHVTSPPSRFFRSLVASFASSSCCLDGAASVVGDSVGGSVGDWVVGDSVGILEGGVTHFSTQTPLGEIPPPSRVGGASVVGDSVGDCM